MDRWQLTQGPSKFDTFHVHAVAQEPEMERNGLHMQQYSNITPDLVVRKSAILGFCEEQNRPTGWRSEARIAEIRDLNGRERDEVIGSGEGVANSCPPTRFGGAP